MGQDGQPQRPVMVHRAPFGSLERFVGVLIEHFDGAFPTWLAPEQARVLPVSEKSNAYAGRVLEALQRPGLRAAADLSSDRLPRKIRDAAEEKIPYLVIVGPKEEAGEQVSIRPRGADRNLRVMALDEFVQALGREVQSRGEQPIRLA